MVRLLLLFVFLSFCGWLPAQVRCDAIRLSERWAHGTGLNVPTPVLAASDLQKEGGPARVTVVVHVVWNTPAENVASATIHEMITTLNNDFQALNADWNSVRPAFTGVRGNPEVHFCLADEDPFGNPSTGITRTQTSTTWFDPDDDPNAMKSAPLGSAPWDPERYLNIWICDISSGMTGGSILAGYAYLPLENMVGSDIDGVVLDFDHGVEGGARTVTHEVGHYLGLVHPWGDGGCGSDDGMDDTPTTDDATQSCSNQTLMNCGLLTQYENFMDYAPCPRMFTIEQAAYMNGVLTNERALLSQSATCGPNSVQEAAAHPPMRLYPQPADALCMLEHPVSGTVGLSIIDARGRTLMQVQHAGPTVLLDTSALPEGPYLIRCIHEHGTHAGRLVVTHP